MGLLLRRPRCLTPQNSLSTSISVTCFTCVPLRARTKARKRRNVPSSCQAPTRFPTRGTLSEMQGDLNFLYPGRRTPHVSGTNSQRHKKCDSHVTSVCLSTPTNRRRFKKNAFRLCLPVFQIRSRTCQNSWTVELELLGIGIPIALHHASPMLIIRALRQTGIGKKS